MKKCFAKIIAVIGYFFSACSLFFKDTKEAIVQYKCFSPARKRKVRCAIGWFLWYLFWRALCVVLCMIACVICGVVVLDCYGRADKDIIFFVAYFFGLVFFVLAVYLFEEFNWNRIQYHRARRLAILKVKKIYKVRVTEKRRNV